MTSFVTWPTRLPSLRGQSQTAGSRSLHPVVQETKFDDGPSRRRRRSLFTQTELSISIIMTPDQFVVFKKFHLVDLNCGARRFAGPVLSPDMRTIVQRTCQIKGEVSWSPHTPTLYLVSFLLLVQDW